ncbi:hypothetical protein Bca52824_018372 [Brassica carinata]|uniref:Uncharacterized protein n=1 Tax=Brassica carinata TaxID=52824 RepID=A0A8X8AXD4_BRACI|nr:hypothetical protein Bca52824_018372 [Brassica carinata]
MSRRSVRAHDPAAPGPSHQYRRDSSSDDEEAAEDSDYASVFSPVAEGQPALEFQERRRPPSSAAAIPPDEAFLRNLQDVPRRVPGERRAPATQGQPEAPVPDFSIMPDIPMRDHGDFQRFVADALQAIWSRVSRCRCMSRRSVRAHDPAAPGPSHQYRRDSSSDDEEAAADSD